MKTLRLLLLLTLNLFFAYNVNAQSCTAPNELTIISWDNINGIEVEWMPSPNANQYSIEVFDVYSNTSIFFDYTPYSLYTLPPGLFNSLNDVVIKVGVECGGIWHYQNIEIYGAPDVWIVYDKICPEEGGIVNSKSVRLMYPTPIYGSTFHTYETDCFCPKLQDIRTYYHNTAFVPVPQAISLKVDPEFTNILGILPWKYRRHDFKTYFEVLYDFNEIERYFAFHCHDLPSEEVYFGDDFFEDFSFEDDLSSGKTSIDEVSKSATKLYPNPTSSGFTFENNDNRKVSVSMYNVIGMEIMQFEMESNSKKYIAAPANANGLYYLKLSYEASKHTEVIPLNIIH